MKTYFFTLPKSFYNRFQGLKKILDNLPFSAKLRWNMIGLVVGMSLLFFSFFLYQVRDTAMDELKKRGRNIALDVAWECELGVLANDERYLIKPLSKEFRSHETVYVMVYDQEGKYLYGKNKLIKPHSSHPVFRNFDFPDQDNVLRKFNNIRLIEFTAPVVTMQVEAQQEGMLFEQEKKEPPLARPHSLAPGIDKPKRTRKRIIGYVKIGISLTNMERQISRLRRSGLMVTVLFLALGIITTYFLAKILSGAITTLTEGAEAIKNGDLDYRIELESHDEFFELAGTFNDMTGALKKRLDEIRRKNEELERFTYTVSHDLKSPLISIQGFSSLFMKQYGKDLDDDGRFFLERIVKNVERMDDLIHDLLQLSRIGRIKGEPEKIGLNEIIEEIREGLQPQLEEKKIELRVPENLPVLYMERISITQVLSNLIINAVKFMGDNPAPKIEIAFQERNGYYQMGIIDNGIGIEKEFQENIFGLFQRLDSDTEGTGIGLAIVRKTVEVWGGTVRVDSESGKGSAFYFTIPVKRPPVKNENLGVVYQI